MKLLGISGSLRAGSFNTQLVQLAGAEFGGDFTLADLNLPLYSGDIEAQGIPAGVQTLSDQIAAADAVVIATPEYNKALSGVLKNALDWVSRTDGNPWAGKPVAILSGTAGRTGGEMAVASLRLALAPFNPDVLNGPNVLVASVHAELENGALVSDRYKANLTDLIKALRAKVGA